MRFYRLSAYCQNRLPTQHTGFCCVIFALMLEMHPEIKELLDAKTAQYNRPDFIESDPICIPHRFSVKEDIEIAGFLAATIAWGNRKATIKSAKNMMQLMGNSPYDFVMAHSKDQLERFNGFVHRTFNSTDMVTFIGGLQNIYQNHGGMETVYANHVRDGFMHQGIHTFRNLMFEVEHQQRTRKHIADPMSNSAAKRIHLFLRWMVRKDNRGVDFGIWKSISPANLSCPLDVHSGNVARRLGLLTRKYDDGKALAELDSQLRALDPDDPVKYDYALFGLDLEKF